MKKIIALLAGVALIERGAANLPVPGQPRQVVVTFDAPVPQKAHEDGFVILNRSYCSDNVILRGCTFRDNRARGVIIQANDRRLQQPPPDAVLRLQDGEGDGDVLDQGAQVRERRPSRRLRRRNGGRGELRRDALRLPRAVRRTQVLPDVRVLTVSEERS